MLMWLSSWADDIYESSDVAVCEMNNYFVYRWLCMCLKKDNADSMDQVVW